MKTLSLLAVLALAACGGGGTLPAPAQSPVPGPTSTANPTASPTATPVPQALRQIGGAPTTATVAQLARVHRRAQSNATQGVTNGLPILVESSGMVASWAGDVGVWTVNAQTQANIAETSLTVVPSGNLPINNPGPQPISCLEAVSAICIVHPTAWTFGTSTFGTSSANGKPVGQQTIAVTFSDGTTGTTFDDVYDGWNLPCNAGWAYVGGVPVAQATAATSDVYADCVNGNIDFPKGAYVLSNPSPDQYGNTATILPQFTAAPIFSAANGVVSMASIQAGVLFALNTQDGGFAKVYFTNAPGSGSINSANGMALHSQTNGSFAL
jgi:hypothetical protein